MNELVTTLLDRRRVLTERRQTVQAAAAELLDAAKREERDLTDDEQTTFDGHLADLRGLDTDAARIDERVAELREQDEREARAADVHAKLAAANPTTARAGVQVGREPLTYERGNGNSFFRDVVMSQVQNDRGAQERLFRHARETEMVAQRYRAEDRMVKRDGDLEARMLAMEVERRAMSRTDGAGGELVPPLWLVEEFAALARAARPTADLATNRPLPGGTDSINVPRITGGGATGVQTADGAAVTSQDMTTDSIQAPVRTIAGQIDMSLQLVEQSPLAFDELVFSDLIADYNTRVDVQVLNGSGASGQVLGLLNVTGINAVTYTDASPTVPEAYPKVADAIQQVHTGRFMPPTVIVMSPRRWAWFLASLDTTNRPLVLPDANAAFNALARQTQVASENVVGQLQGLPVVIDASIPLTLGAGTNEDVILVMRASDQWLWEGALRTRTLPEVLSGTLQVRMQIYAYLAFMAGRYPKGISKLTGTGLAAPAF